MNATVNVIPGLDFSSADLLNNDSILCNEHPDFVEKIRLIEHGVQPETVTKPSSYTERKQQDIEAVVEQSVQPEYYDAHAEQPMHTEFKSTKPTLKSIFVRKNALVLTIIAGCVIAAPIIMLDGIHKAKQSFNATLNHVQQTVSPIASSTPASVANANPAVIPMAPANQVQNTKAAEQPKIINLPDGSKINVAPLPPVINTVEPKPATLGDVADKAIELKNQVSQTLNDGKVAAQDLKMITEVNQKFSTMESTINKLNSKIDTLNSEIKQLKSKPVAQPPIIVEQQKPTPAKKAQPELKKNDAPIIAAGEKKTSSQPSPIPNSVETAPRAKFGIVDLGKDEITINTKDGRKVVHVGEQMPDGATVLRVIQASGIVVTDKTILKLSQ